MCTDLFTVLSQFTRVTDGQTDGRTEFSSPDRVCIPCSAVKMNTPTYNGDMRVNGSRAPTLEPCDQSEFCDQLARVTH